MAFLQLLDDIGIAGGGKERGKPVFMRENLVRNGSRLDDARPTRQARNPESAFLCLPLLSVERRGTAVGPSELLGAVVGRKDHDGVVGNAQVIEFLQQLTHDPV